MDTTLLMFIVGVSLLVFRLWLVELKLVDELQFRRRYLSRVINYYMWLSMASGFELKPLNWIVVGAFPVLVVAAVWDSRFYRRYSTRTYWHKNLRWLLVERLTLHPPMMTLGLFMILTDPKHYVTDVGLQPIWLGILLVFVPFFFLDERWTHRYNWPQAPIVISLLLGATTIMALAQVFIWGVPLL